MRPLLALALALAALAAACPARAQTPAAPPVLAVDSLAGQHAARSLADPFARASAPDADGRVAVAFDVPLHGSQIFGAYFDPATRADTVALALDANGDEICTSDGSLCSYLHSAPTTVRVTLRARAGARGTLRLVAMAPRQFISARTRLGLGQPVRLDRVSGGGAYVRAYAFVPVPGRPVMLHAETDSADVDLRLTTFRGLREGRRPAGPALTVRAGREREQTWLDGGALGDTAVVLVTSGVRAPAPSVLLVAAGLDSARVFGWVDRAEVRRWIWTEAASAPPPVPCDTATADLAGGRVGGVPVGATVEQAASLTCPRWDADTRGPQGTGLSDGSWFVFPGFNGRARPDVFGLSEAEARRVLAEAGLGAPAVVLPGRGLRYARPYGCLSLALGQDSVIMALMRPTACALPDD